MSRREDARHQLEASGLDFLTLPDHSPERAHLLFRGPFQGEEVVWDCHIIPLLAPQQLQDSAEIHQFIEIPLQKNNNSQRIDIGLSVITITRAVILKTIIMVRQYRNLDYGHHLWK